MDMRKTYENEKQQHDSLGLIEQNSNEDNQNFKENEYAEERAEPSLSISSKDMENVN